MSTLSTHAKEQSTYVIDVSFADETAQAIVPNEAFWTLMDAQGTVINDREDVEIMDLSATVQIVLSDLDLAILADEMDEGKRVLKIRAAYDSDLGMGLPLIDEVIFYVDNLL
jgi:hypothetical protein